MITYSWKINSLSVTDKNNLQKVIVLIEWERIASSTDKFGDLVTESYPGKIGLEDPDPDNFIQLENLQRELVESWIMQVQTPEDVMKIDEILHQRIIHKISDPIKKIPSPWNY